MAISYAGLNTLDALVTKMESRYQKKSAVATYTMVKSSSATEGMLASYYLQQTIGETSEQVGATIDIPKDFLVKSATIETCEQDNVPVQGYEVGDKYIDFVVNTVEGSAQDTHIYLLVNELVDAYQAGYGLQLDSQNNTFSIKLKTGSTNGLAVDANGLSLALASGDTFVQATGTYVEGTVYYTDATGATTVDTTGFVEGETDVSSYYVEQEGTAGAMSASDKTKLNGIAPHANNYTHPSYTATTGGETADQTPSFGETFIVSQVVSDSSGHITSQTNRTVTIPNAVATPNTTTYVQASGTYVSGTKYYTDNTGATEVDTTSFVEGVTDVSNYYVAQVTAGTAGLMSANDKTKLDSFTEITAQEVNALFS